MSKTFLCTLLMVSCLFKSHAQSPSKEICWAKGSETELKFGLDYRNDAYHLLLKNLKESNNVGKQNDQYVFKTNDGCLIKATLTEDIMSATSGDSYYSFDLTPKQVACLSNGLSSIEMIRDGKSTSFNLYKYTSNNIQNAVVQVRQDSVQAEKQKIADEKARLHAEAKQLAEQKKKDEYEAWLASCTPEYLATVKNYSYVYGGYSREWTSHKGENGAKVGILHAFNLTKRAPLFIEFGGEVTFYHETSKNKVSVKTTNNALSATLPINFSYKFTDTGKIVVVPYIGINLNYNLYGKDKLQYQMDKCKVIGTFNYFGEKTIAIDVKGEENNPYISNYKDEITKRLNELIQSNRFQFGGQVGVRIGYKNIFFGAEYRRLTPYIKHGKGINTGNVTVGYMF